MDRADSPDRLNVSSIPDIAPFRTDEGTTIRPVPVESVSAVRQVQLGDLGQPPLGTDLVGRPEVDLEYAELKENRVVERKKYIYWQDDDMWLGYLEEYPDYMTQGKTFEELEGNLQDLYKELNSGNIPHVRRVAELEVK